MQPGRAGKLLLLKLDCMRWHAVDVMLQVQLEQQDFRVSQGLRDCQVTLVS